MRGCGARPVFKKGVCILGLFLLEKTGMMIVYRKRSFIVHPVLLMPKKQTIVDRELVCVPIDEEEERIIALTQWIAAHFGYLPELPEIVKRLSGRQEWSND